MARVEGIIASPPDIPKIYLQSHRLIDLTSKIRDELQTVMEYSIGLQGEGDYYCKTGKLMII